MAIISGVIALVQEDRFQLVADDGQRRLFLLSHTAPIELEDLQNLERSGRRVTIHYHGSDRLIAGAVEAIELAEAV